MGKAARAHLLGSLRFDADVAPRNDVTGVSLHPYKAWAAAAFCIRVVKGRRLLAFSRLGVCQIDGVVVGLDYDLVFKPNAGNERRAGRVVLEGGFVFVQVPD